MNARMKLLCCVLLASVAAGCKPPPARGSERWCKELDAKPKADWNSNDTSVYTRNCIFEKHTNE